ncbi:MAG: hypothetical protein ACRENS_03545, partial [Candidatus Eiseniibacteriota bacterium]
LFGELRQAGFAWEPFNDHKPTLQLRFHRLDEVRTLPWPLDRMAPALFGWAERRAALRLDWFAGRGWGGGRGYTVRDLYGLDHASDHSPMLAEFDF